MRVKLVLAGGGWGCARPPPLITFTLTGKVAVYAPAEWADTLTLFHLYENMYSVGAIQPIPAIAYKCNDKKKTKFSSYMRKFRRILCKVIYD
jgi:hypothetical protein